MDRHASQRFVTSLHLYLIIVGIPIVPPGPRLLQERMRQRLLGTDPPVRIQVQTPLQEPHGQHLLVRQRLLGAVLPAVVPARRPQDDLLEREARAADRRDRALEDGAVQVRARLHALGAKDGRDLDHGLDVVGRVEEGEAPREDREQDHARRPDVDLGALVGTLEQHLGRPKPARAGAVRAPRGPRVVLRVAVRGPRVGSDAGLHAAFALVGVLLTETRFGIGAFAFRQPEVDEHAALLVGLVEEVRGLDVAVDDALEMHGGQGLEERAEVDLHLRDRHLTEVLAEVRVPEVGEHGDDLVCRAERRDERTDRVEAAEVVEELQLVEDARGTAGDVDLLDGHVFGTSA